MISLSSFLFSAALFSFSLPRVFLKWGSGGLRRRVKAFTNTEGREGRLF